MEGLALGDIYELRARTVESLLPIQYILYKILLQFVPLYLKGTELIQSCSHSLNEEFGPVLSQDSSVPGHILTDREASQHSLQGMVPAVVIQWLPVFTHVVACAAVQIEMYCKIAGGSKLKELITLS